MKEKNNKINGTNLVIIIIAGFAIVLSLFSFIKVSSFMKTRAEENVVAENISYRIYVGINDKDKKTQVIKDDEALELIKTICINNGEGYTIFNANGGYIDDGKVYTKKNFCCRNG